MRSFCILIFIVMAIVNLPGTRCQIVFDPEPCPEENCKIKDRPAECSAPLDGYEPCSDPEKICCVLPSRRQIPDTCAGAAGGVCVPRGSCYLPTPSSQLCPDNEECCLDVSDGGDSRR